MDNEVVNDLVNQHPFTVNGQTVTFARLPRGVMIDFFLPGVEFVVSQLDGRDTDTITITQTPQSNISLITFYSIIYRYTYFNGSIRAWLRAVDS